MVQRRGKERNLIMWAPVLEVYQNVTLHSTAYQNQKQKEDLCDREERMQ